MDLLYMNKKSVLKSLFVVNKYLCVYISNSNYTGKKLLFQYSRLQIKYVLTHLFSVFVLFSQTVLSSKSHKYIFFKNSTKQKI